MQEWIGRIRSNSMELENYSSMDFHLFPMEGNAGLRVPFLVPFPLTTNDSAA